MILGLEVHGYVIIPLKKRAPHMIRQQPNQTEFTDFIHPFGGKLPASNRWIKLSQLVPWDEIWGLESAIEEALKEWWSKAQGFRSLFSNSYTRSELNAI